MRVGTNRSLVLLRWACLSIAMVLGGIAAALSAFVYAATAEPVDEISAMVSGVARESMAVADSYLSGAEAAAATATTILQTFGRQPSESHLTVLHSAVANNPSLDAAFVGYDDGSFAFVGRSLENPHGFRTRLITNGDSADRQVTISERDRAFAVVLSENEVVDEYDPTHRPWWTDSLPQDESPRSIWTDAYPFASSGEFGVTHARPLINGDGSAPAVVGVDVRLTELAEFLSRRAPSKGGTAHIFGADGSLVASSNPDILVPDGLQTVVAARAAQSLQPSESARDEPLRHIWNNDGARTVSAVSGVGANDSWTLVVSAPTGDFLTGFRSSLAPVRGALLGIGIIMPLTMALAAWWLWTSIRRLHRDATTDRLTGLLNRGEATDRLDALISTHRTPETLLVGIVDLDNFKLINDQLGHRTGDHAIIVAARFLQRGVGNRGFVSRLGGDEFLVVLRGSAGPVEFVLDEILHGLSLELGRMITDPSIPPVTASCGYHLHRDDAHANSASLLRRADVALLNAKLTRNCSMKFAPGMTLPRPALA